MRRFVIVTELLGLILIAAEAAFLLTDESSYHFVGYIGAFCTCLGAGVYSKFSRR